MNSTRMSGIEQGRAEFAYKCAKEVADMPKAEEDHKKKYRAHVKDVPMMIKTNGLGATFAFIFSKKDKASEKAYRLIYEHITKWLEQERTHLIDLSNNKSLVEELVKLKSPAYRAVTIEVLAFFAWLRRFAEGLIEEKEEKKS